MIANLYVDHLMSTPPVSTQEVWNQTQAHAKLFSDAASRIGLTPEEYSEFRAALLDGKALYVRLPKRFDAMSGNRRGSVYAVKNAVLKQNVRGWRIDLADGNTVYVPQLCGNISLLKRHHVDVAALPKAIAPVARTPHAKFHPAVATVPKDNEVVVAPPPAVEDVPGAAAAPVEAQVVPIAAAAAASHGGFLFLIPAVLGGIIAGHGGGGTSGAAPCQPPINSLSMFKL
ncbi:MAG: hypothetical protein NVS2B3_05990 [Vulcanimicrobiaceae bacterium]